MSWPWRRCRGSTSCCPAAWAAWRSGCGQRCPGLPHTQSILQDRGTQLSTWADRWPRVHQSQVTVNHRRIVLLKGLQYLCDHLSASSESPWQQIPDDQVTWPQRIAIGAVFAHHLTSYCTDCTGFGSLYSSQLSMVGFLAIRAPLCIDIMDQTSFRNKGNVVVFGLNKL